jgi:hypothetical protein
MKDKVKIIIRETYENGEECKLLDGSRYTSVGFNAKRYGMGYHCKSEDIASAIKHAKEWIIREGDIPILADKRKKATLEAWI